MKSLCLVVCILAIFIVSQCRDGAPKERTDSAALAPQKSTESGGKPAPLPLEFKVDLNTVKSIARREILKFDTDGSMPSRRPISTSFNLKDGAVATIIHEDHSNVRRRLVLVFFDDLENPGQNAFVVLEKTGNKYVPFERAMSIESKSQIMAGIRADKALFDED